MEQTLTLKRTFNALPEEIFRAWTVPEELSKWLGPDGIFVHVMDAREDGAYKITLGRTLGEELHGEYKIVNQPQTLVMTWQREGGDETLVTMECIDLDGKTEMVLTHSGFSDEMELREQREKWSSGLERLRQMFP